MKSTATKSDVPVSILKKLQTLLQIAEDLHGGKDFSITRLTILKGLCNDPDAAAQFALHLAKKTQQAMRGKKRVTEKSKRYQRLVASAVRQMTEYLKKPTGDGEKLLWALFSEIRGGQNRHEHQQWGPVRIIESRELLVVETALECVLRPAQSALFSYDMARQYAERYNTRYGTGLIPESAPLVEDIAGFWGSHFLGRGWRKQLAQ